MRVVEEKGEGIVQRVTTEKNGLLKLVFLTYINRSGSTFLANQLSKHPDISVAPEAEILIKFFLEHPGKVYYKRQFPFILKALRSNRKFQTWNFPFDQLKRSLDTYSKIRAFEFFLLIAQLFVRFNKPSAQVWMFKGTRLLYLVDKIMNTLGKEVQVKFIYLFRDPRAVFASQKKSIGTYHGRLMSENPVKTAMEWKDFHNTANSVSTKHPLTEVKYEELILNFDAEIERILGQIGIASTEDFSSTASFALPANQRHLHENINKAPDPAILMKWKNELSEREIRIVSELTADELLHSGYKPEYPNRGSGKISSFRWIGTYRLKQFRESVKDNLRRLKFWIRFNFFPNL